MTKTPKEMAKQYVKQENLAYDEAAGGYYGFLAGYQAAVQASVNTDTNSIDTSTKMNSPEKMSELNNELEPVTWDEIKKFYKDDFNETLPENYRESFCYAWSQSRKMPVIDLLATGYRAAQHQAKIDFAAKYDHKSPLQVIAAEYVKRRGTIGPLALMEENRFIDGYEAGLHASDRQWISVKDKLPDYDQLVLLWQSELQAQFVGRREESGVMSPLYYWNCTSDFFEAWKEIYHPKLMNEEIITHWQPLPKPPEE